MGGSGWDAGERVSWLVGGFVGRRLTFIVVGGWIMVFDVEGKVLNNGVWND